MKYARIFHCITTPLNLSNNIKINKKSRPVSNKLFKYAGVLFIITNDEIFSKYYLHEICENIPLYNNPFKPFKQYKE